MSGVTINISVATQNKTDVVFINGVIAFNNTVVPLNKGVVERNKSKKMPNFGKISSILAKNKTKEMSKKSQK